MDFDRKTWAEAEGPVTTWSARDMGLDEDYIGLQGSPTIVSGVATAPSAERRREFLSGTPEEEAQQLLERIRSSIRLD